MPTDGYNGWRNRETWLVNLWFNPESQADLDYLQEFLQEEFDKIECGCLKDMINLGAIDWRELAESVADEEQDDEEEDDEEDESNEP